MIEDGTEEGGTCPNCGSTDTQRSYDHDGTDESGHVYWDYHETKCHLCMHHWQEEKR